MAPWGCLGREKKAPDRFIQWPVQGFGSIWWRRRVVCASSLRQDYACRRVEDERGSGPSPEIEHPIQLSGNHIRGTIANAAETPVVFDKAENRRLIGNAMVNVVLLCKGRNDEQGKTRAIATTAVLRRAAGLRDCGRAAIARAEELVIGNTRLPDERAELMVVPAVGIIVGDDDGCRIPVRALHDGVDGVHEEDLFIEGIGIRRMAILIGTGFEEGDGREIPAI